MRGIPILCFLLALPVLAALGHDIYITYQDQDFTRAMMFSDVGYLWTHYEPGSYKWAQDNIDKATWDSFLTPLLEQSTVIIAAIPAVIVYSLLLILKLLNLPPFSDGVRVGKGHKKGNFAYSNTDKSKGRFKYNRK
jgi:hypothetical protein